MPYTSHGHAYGWINTDQPRPPLYRCGGVRGCRACAAEAANPPSDPRDAQIVSLRLDVDRYGLEVARLRAVVYQVVEIPREPDPQPDDYMGEAYTAGWQAARALVDQALLPEVQG